jgi:predicted ribosomally synthesized peptide with nif11-like leader
MSEQSAQAFIERIKSDAAFRDKVLAEAEPEARLALINAAGYDCSADDIAGLSGALSDADLGAVSAGLWDVCSTNTCGAHCTAHSGY